MIVWIISDPEDNHFFLTVDPKVVEKAREIGGLEIQEWDTSKQETCHVALENAS